MLRYDFDVIVIGGGLLGCFAARNLARYDMKIALLEKREDLCLGISRANTAIVYSGCDTKPGSLKTSMCVRASQGFEDLCGELGVRYSKCGSVMVCFGESGAGVLRKKFEQGIKNGVRGSRLLSREETLGLEPKLSSGVFAGLYVPDTGTVMPWELCIAAAENAVANGVEIIRNTEVKKISRDSAGYIVETGDDKNVPVFHSRGIVNCAGLCADAVLEKVFEPTVRIVPDAGDYFVLDTKAQGFIRHVIFHELEEKGKGLTLVPTVDGNILVGPTERSLAEARGREADEAGATRPGRIDRDGGDAEDMGFETAIEGLDSLRSMVAEVIPGLPMEHVIRSFGAVRPNPYEVEVTGDRDQGSGRGSQDSGYGEKVTGSDVRLSDRSVNDFCIVEEKDEAFISFVGVKTPGLTCANELGEYAADRLADRLGAKTNKNFDPRREAPVRLVDLSFEERERFVRVNPDYGRVVCRCGRITEGEALDAIRRRPGAVTLDGVKHRAGTGLGRCQGGFCTQHIAELLSRELGGKPEDFLSR